MIKSCCDWFPCCHNFFLHPELIWHCLHPPVSPVHPVSFSLFPFLFLRLFSAARAHLKYFNAVGYCPCSAIGVLAQADVWILTASEMNAKKKCRWFWRVKDMRETLAKYFLTLQSSNQPSSALKITENIYEISLFFNPLFQVKKGKLFIFVCVHVS